MTEVAITEAASISVPNGYSEYIQEVFINPIRSVLVVDDKFPTLDALIEGQLTSDLEIDKLKKILNMCRSPERNWLLDVHDAKNINLVTEESSIHRLHQSDLLILDYNLNGDDDDPTKSLRIIEEIAKNDHFNLVVVYSKQSAEKVFSSILKSTLGKWNEINGEHIDQERLSELDDEYGHNLAERLKKSVTPEDYLRIRHLGVLNLQDGKANPFTAQFKKTYSDLEIKEGDWAKEKCFKWVLQQVEQEAITDKGFTDVRWGFSSEEDKCWLRTSKMFLTVVSKNQHNLIEELIGALTTWKPSPNRLIATKVRNELEAHGVSAENEALIDHELQCSWLENLRNANDGEKSVQLASLIERNNTEIIGAIKSQVEGFASRVIDNIKQSEASSASFFGMNSLTPDQEKNATLRHNVHINSMPPLGYHLTTGHVLLIDDNYWICTTPACDLVPDRNGRNDRLKTYEPALPFKGLKLYPISEKKALKKATTGSCIFLKIDDQIKTFHIKKDAIETASPNWIEMYADNEGKFIEDTKTLHIGMLTHDESLQEETREDATTSERPPFTIKWQEVSVISQLRYEYAINLMNSIGQSTTRVGLEYLNHNN